MPTLVWDSTDREYEAGVDRGVLYLPDGTGVAWNGLVSVIEKYDIKPEGTYDKSGTSIYFDGKKINDFVSLGAYNATLTAITYPDEFAALEGSAEFRNGVLLSDQMPQMFGLCYRTSIGDGDGGLDAYKLHVLYNVLAMPHEKSYSTITDQQNLVEFAWDINAIPEDIPGYRPTAHITIDSREVDPLLLKDVEGILYGKDSNSPTLMPMADLLSFMENWYRILITDNGDGSWTATIRDDLDVLTWLDEPDETEFSLKEANVVFSDSDETEFTISSTTDISQIATEIKIIDNGDGTWSATSDSDVLVPPMTPEGEFTILDADATIFDDRAYQISDSEQAQRENDDATIVIIDNGDGTWTAFATSLPRPADDGTFEIDGVNAFMYGNGLYHVSSS